MEPVLRIFRSSTSGRDLTGGALRFLATIQGGNPGRYDDMPLLRTLTGGLEGQGKLRVYSNEHLTPRIPSQWAPFVPSLETNRTEETKEVDKERYGHTAGLVAGCEGVSGGKSGAEVHLEREIMNAGLCLATFLDAHHPNPAVFSSTAERMVRLLVDLEAAISINPTDRTGFYGKKIGFLGRGGESLEEE